MAGAVTKTYDWAALVRTQEEQSKPEEDVAYEFSNGRGFEREPDGGVYADDEQP